MTIKDQKDEYTCESCHNTYTKGWSDEEANKEMNDNFPGLADDEQTIVCDDCFTKIMGWRERKTYLATHTTGYIDMNDGGKLKNVKPIKL